MKNPYDREKEPEKYEFFKSMTESINEFMLKTYPKFDSQLKDQIKHLISLKDEIRESLRDHKEECAKHVISKVELFLKKEHPEISNRFSQISIELQRITEDLQKAVRKHNTNEEKFEKKLEIVVKSNSLYEDVYKMRDELVDIKIFMESFKKKIKKAFDV